MAIQHDTFLFQHIHGELQAGPWDAPLLPAAFPGVIGESHLVDERKGRNLACLYTIDQQQTEAVLNQTIETINAKINRLTGTLLVQTDSVTQYPKTTFLGYAERDRFKDGAGGKWVSQGLLRWRQRGPNA